MLLLRRAALLLVVAVAPLWGACATTRPSQLGPLEDAAKDAERDGAPARTHAFAGFHAWFVGGDVEKARGHFDRAVELDVHEPYAHYGHLLLARRAEHPERALEAALALVEQAPTHPLSVAAARQVMELAGVAGPLDALVLARVPKALEAGAAGDTAHLLRSALALVHQQHGDEAARDRVLGEMGVVTTYALVGPFSAFDLLDFDVPTPPEQSGSLAGPLQGALGPLSPRQLRFPDGRLSLAGENPRGDGFLLAVDVTVTNPGLYVVRTSSSAPHRATLGGTELFARRPFERASPTVSARAVQLEAGTHRLLVKLFKDDRAGGLTLAVLRADGQPAALRFEPARGPAKAWGGVAAAEPGGVFAPARALHDALEEEAGPLLATYAAAQDALERDPDGAAALFSALDRPLVEASAALLHLSAELALADEAVPQKVAHGRATRDLESTLGKDERHVRALLARANLALEDGRLDEASSLLEGARAAHQPPGYPVALFEARYALALGVDAEVDAAARRALEAQAGLCEALQLRYDLSRRQDAARGADELLGALGKCPGARSRAAEHARSRGELDTAITHYEGLVAQDPSHLAASSSLVNLYVSRGRHDDALRLLERQLGLWPRNAVLKKRLADVHELAGRADAALRVREEALLLDGSDLSLRRTVSRARTGKEPLQEHAVLATDAVKAYEQSPGREDAAGAYVLDAATVQVFPDGAMLDRVHIIRKVLDQSAIQEIAEVEIPPGAQVLALRTRKADGRVLEPEAIEGKDSISMPGVQVGDYVEYEYLQAHGARWPGMPGFTAPSFYFQLAGQPNTWATYTVLAPKGMGMSVEPRGLTVKPVETVGDQERFHHEERRVPPFIPEPQAPPSQNEVLPHVTVGAGQTGNEGLVKSYADAFLSRGARSHEVDAFARAAVGEARGLDAVRALHTAVMEKLSGRDAGLAVPASASVAQDRGSRLWLLKASLEAVGIPTRIAAVRTFNTDPAPSRFPNERLLPYFCLRAELPEGPVWLDTAIRFGPFATLPEAALGEREAYLLPEPGRPLEKVKTPPAREVPGKRIELDLQLSADGQLSGTGVERYEGFEGAQLIEALEALSPDQRTQALQRALSRYFGGAELDKLELELPRKVGAPLAVRYRFQAPRFARVEGKRLVLGPLTFPMELGRRYVQLNARSTPLYVDNTERTRTQVSVKLPPGFSFEGEPLQHRLEGKLGRFERVEKVEGGVLRVDEDVQLFMARVPPERYDAFADFAGQVDLLQTRDIVLTQPGTKGQAQLR